MRSLIFLAISALLLASTAFAQQDLRQDQFQPRDVQQPANDIEGKRQFLQKLFARQLKDPKQIHEALTRLQQATPQEIEKLMAAYEKKARLSQEKSMAQAKQDLARAKAYQQYLQSRVDQQRRGNPGFAPVITTLPSGTFFPVRAVISPDRRYVRITTAPFFSSVGPVRTFNTKNGQSGFVPGFGPQQQGPPALRPLYYNGMRTRISPAPTRGRSSSPTRGRVDVRSVR